MMQCGRLFWGHQLISKPTWDSWNEHCRSGKDAFNPQMCQLLAAKMTSEVGNLNPYALDYPVCLSKDGTPQLTSQVNQLLNYLSLEDDSRKSYPLLKETSDYEPCTENYATDYLNQESVKEAIHVDTSIVWKDCSTTTKYKMFDRLIPMQPLYKDLVANEDLRILVYSGDDDSVCGTVGTQSWIYDLDQAPLDLWNVWEVDGQVAGYLTKFENLNFAFATVRNAGHEVPAYRPKEAFVLFESYLNGEWFQE